MVDGSLSAILIIKKTRKKYMAGDMSAKDKSCCKLNENIEIIKEYDPQPKNKDGAVRWYLFWWDDGKKGVRRLVRCKCCDTFYLVQAYHLHKFSEYKNTLFEDWYLVDGEKQADYLNRNYTGIELEHKLEPVFKRRYISSGEGNP